MGGQKKIVNFQKMDTLKKTRLKKRRIRKINITKTCHKKNGHNEKILHFLKMGVRKKKPMGAPTVLLKKKIPHLPYKPTASPTLNFSEFSRIQESQLSLPCFFSFFMSRLVLNVRSSHKRRQHDYEGGGRLA